MPDAPIVYSFTQPVCDQCWYAEFSSHPPTRQVKREEEVCCRCGRPTWNGVYVRVDPSSVKHPTRPA